jgi:hypothetical protein
MRSPTLLNRTEPPTAHRPGKRVGCRHRGDATCQAVIIGQQVLSVWPSQASTDG